MISTSPIPTSLAEAEALDQTDPLRHARMRFALPDGIIYLDGHSLGPATHASLALVQETASRDWAQGLIGSWNATQRGPGWIDLPQRVGAMIARLIGAPPETVIVSDSVSVNLFKLAAAALPLAGARRVMVETDDFPTDQYIAEGVSRMTGAQCLKLPPGGGVEALSQGGVLIKSAVNYRSAAVTDIAAHETVARAGGGLIVWDLSHATGVLSLDLAAQGARLATGCTYKYLNGGPGAPAFLYADAALAERMQTPLPGWFGHAAPFDFDSAYRPRDGVQRFASGTPGVLSLAALHGALTAFDGIELTAMQAKARALGDVCLMRAGAMGLASASPRNGAERGGHVTLTHADGFAIVNALIARGIIGDFRAPDAIRFGFSPLYVGFADVWRAMDALEETLTTRTYAQPQFAVRGAVT